MPGGMLLLLAGLLLFVGYRMGRRQRAPRWLACAIGLAVALVPIAVVRATTTFGVPFTFTNGTVADATQVNQNFSAVTTEINNLRNQTAVLVESDFRPRTSSEPVSFDLGNGGAFISGTPNGDGTLTGAVRVPQGAVITSIDVWVTDLNSSVNVQACLWGLFDASGGYDESTPCATTTGAPGIIKTTVVPLSGGVVQGTGLNYEVLVFSVDGSGTHIPWPTDGTITVRSAYVHYQVP
jgi:hypothetical protein